MKLFKNKSFYKVLSIIPMMIVLAAPVVASSSSLFWIHVPQVPKELHK